MDFPDIDELNKRFGAPGRVAFRAGPGGLPLAVMVNKHGAVELSLYGGQVLFSGSPEALVADPNVRRLYLGESFAM